MKPARATLLALAATALALTACAAQRPAATAPAAAPAPAASAPASTPTTTSPPNIARKIDPVAVGAALFQEGRTLEGGKVTFTGGGPMVGSGACANCHGKDAEGKVGPMISWAMLTSAEKMDMMPKYVYKTPDQVFTAVTTGKRPDGTQLRPMMPRYELTAEEFEYLVAFLKTK
jgi:hypothetical protein